MEQYTIDFSGVKTYWFFYNAIIVGLDFPDWCGQNLDAIWDMLIRHMDAPVTIYVKGIYTLPESLTEKKDLFLKILNRAVNWYAKINQTFIVKIID